MTSGDSSTVAESVRLTTFGTVALDGPAGPMSGVAVQRRRLALLALLAASGNGLSRDRLVGLLWPESDDERARHALAQLVHALRRTLGDDSIESGGAVLRLNTNRVTSDVSDFVAAVERGDHERVASLFRAPFLDGFYLDGCPEFERWVDERRAELAGQAESALRDLATDASRLGDHHHAVQWCRRLAVLRPLDSRVALMLIRAMVAAGDRAGAIQQGLTHEAMVRAELDAPADDAILALVAELRAPNRAAPVGGNASVERSHEVQTIKTPPAFVSAPLPPAAPIARARRKGIVIGVAVATSVFAAAAAMLGLQEATGPVNTGSMPWVVIADAENRTGDPVFDHTVPVALAASLAQSPHARVVAPDRVGRALVRMRRPAADSVITERVAREIARREGASLVTVPVINRVADGYELSARVIDGASGAVLAFPTARAANRSDVMAALDRLGRELRRGLGESNRSIGKTTVALPRVTTSSLDALEKFADGSRAWDRARLTEARTLWMQAVSLDTNFAGAHAALGMLEHWNNNTVAGNRHFEEALSHLDALPEHEQILIRAHALEWRGDRAAAVAILSPLLVEHADDAVALDAIAYDYFRLRRFQEAAETYARLLAIDSMNSLAWIDRAESESNLGRHLEALRSFGRGFAIDPSLLTANNNLNLEYATALVRAGHRDSATVVIDRLAAQPDPLRRARGLRSKAFLAEFDGRYADAARGFGEAAALSRAARSRVGEVRNRLLLATVLTNLGRTRDANSQLDSAYAIADSVKSEASLVFWLGKALARAGNVRRASHVLSVLESVHATGSSYRSALGSLRAEVLLAERKPAEARAQAEAAVQADSTAQGMESLALAFESSGALNRAADGYQWLAAHAPIFGAEGQHEAQFAAFWLGRVNERSGNVGAARAAYELFLTKWPATDTSAVPDVADARRRLRRLQSSAPHG